MRHSIHKVLLSSVALILCTLGGYGQKTFDLNRYLELTTTLETGSKATIAINGDAWVDLNANGQQDEGEVLRPEIDEMGQPQLFTLTLAAQTLRIYGAFTEIILRKWRLSSIDVSRMTQLTYLGVPYGQLEQIDLSALTELKSLEARNNRLRELDLSHQSQLELIEVISNYFTRLDLTHKPNLYFVGVAHNEIQGEDMDFLVNTLPLRREGFENEGQLFVYTLNEPTEKNLITDRQAAIADGKYWNVQAWDASQGDWVKYEGEPTALDSPSRQPDRLRAFYTGHTLAITGTTIDQPLYLLDATGQLIATIHGEQETTTYPIDLPAGHYIIAHLEQTTTLTI